MASGASSLADLRELSTTRVIDIELRKMDDFALEKSIERIDVVKCDVEGAELFVFKGGLETLKRCKPVVFSEMLRKWSAKQGYHPHDIIGLFRDIGYACYTVNGGYLNKLNFVTDSTVETNYFFLHDEKHKEIVRLLSHK